MTPPHPTDPAALREAMPRGVSVILYRDGKFCVSQRLAKITRLPGLWQFAGGHVESDEAPLAAAQRELREETGLDLWSERFTLIGIAGPLKGYNGESYMGYRYGVVLNANEEPACAEPDKHTAWTWITPQELLEHDMLQATKEYAFLYAMSLTPFLSPGGSEPNMALIGVAGRCMDSLRRYAVECFPEITNDQKHFVRVLMESWADEIQEALLPALKTLTAPTVTPGEQESPSVAKRDWVNCPICGEPDMRREEDRHGNVLIMCVNHACASNGGGNASALKPVPVFTAPSAEGKTVETEEVIRKLNDPHGDYSTTDVVRDFNTVVRQRDEAIRERDDQASVIGKCWKALGSHDDAGCAPWEAIERLKSALADKERELGEMRVKLVQVEADRDREAAKVDRLYLELDPGASREDVK